jgi:F-type H+-transporting ATPase subunit gamma
VKATQKITKAMQMVAAAKLKRAQEAGEAARPYAQRMAAVSPISPGVSGDGAPGLLAGTGKDEVHLLVVCTAERAWRRLQRPIVVRAAHMTASTAWPKARRSRSSPWARRSRDILRRACSATRLIIDASNCAINKVLGFVNAEPIAKKVIARVRGRKRFDVVHAVLFQFKSVISADPDRQQLIPAASLRLAAPINRERRRLRLRTGAERNPPTLLPRNISVQVLPGAAREPAGEMGPR